MKLFKLHRAKGPNVLPFYMLDVGTVFRYLHRGVAIKVSTSTDNPYDEFTYNTFNFKSNRLTMTDDYEEVRVSMKINDIITKIRGLI